MTGSKLSDLFQSLPGEKLVFARDTLVTGIAHDSRQVKPGDLFVAFRGASVDGHNFIPQAIERGASAVVGTQPLSVLPVPYVQVGDSRLALAHISAAFYDFPARRLTVIGVTGTDGKTTTANLIFHILRTAGLRAGMISTVNAVIGVQTLDTGFHVTTPDAQDVQSYLAQMVADGLTHAVLEATSHGLAQQRLAACDFDLGVVTNITHEHLDYHGTYEAYRAAKGTLFSSLAQSHPKPFQPPRGGVLNRDDASFDYLSEIIGVRALSYGQHSRADVRPVGVEQHEDGLRFEVLGCNLAGEAFNMQISTCLVGLHNLSNCLAAIATTRGVLGLEVGAVQVGIASMPGVPGRMERIDLGQDFIAMVDFAHTPNALRCALLAARPMTEGRVIAVFGSAGLRDRAKRSLMAQVSAELADLTVLTAEDPRSESLEDILAEMVSSMIANGGVEGKSFWRVPDRGEAIRLAVRIADPGDLVIACGKGHEQSMCFGETEFPWDDRLAMRAALAEHLGIPGQPMPYLPTQDL